MLDFLWKYKRAFQGKYIVATNLQFDLVALFFGTYRWNDLKLLWNKNRIITAQIQFKDSNKHGRIEFIDTINFNPCSVASLGKIVNIPKMEIDKEVLTKKNVTKEQLEYIKEYNINDSLISMSYMYHLQDTLNNLGGNIKLTIPSCSLDLFRRKFMTTIFIKERVVLDDNTIEEFILKGYYGGRCESFAIGEFNNVNYYDVNSLYPTMMLKQYPIPQSIKVGHNTELEILTYLGMSECIVECPLNMSIPILPMRTDEDKIFYPTGTLKGTWTHALLSYAIEKGYKIKEIIKQYIYTEQLPLFRDYITTLYDIRKQYKELKNPEEVTIKLLMNSLYGKFGQKPSDIYEVIDGNANVSEVNKRLKNGYEMEKSSDDNFFICTKKGTKYPKNSFPILSAYVTSYGQIHLHKLLSEYKPLYCDTDSIMTQEKIPEDLISSSELGLLKLEKLGTVELYAPKNYAFNGKPTLKGLHFDNSLSDVEKYKIFKNYNSGLKVQQTNFMKLKSSLKSVKGYTPNQIINIYKSRKITTSDKRIYNENYSIPIEVTNG
jgi:hypothetical protein